LNTRQTSGRQGAAPQNQTAATPPQNAVVAANPKLMTAFAAQYGIDANKMVGILRGTAFKANPPATDEEVAALVVVANIYHLNPFLREIYAFRNQSGGITPIIGVDGWCRIVESQPAYEGEEMKSGYDDTMGPDDKPLGFYYECFIYRRDRKFPTSRRQYYKENYRKTTPWDTMPTRMLQHRAYIQSARAAFGLGGIYDEDEGERIANAINVTPTANGTKPQTRVPRELPPQDTGRTLEHQPAQSLDPQPLQQPETVDTATGEIQAGAQRVSLASEPQSFEPDDEAGSRG
jgi:phage recombination protein Bet